MRSGQKDLAKRAVTVETREVTKEHMGGEEQRTKRDLFLL